MSHDDVAGVLDEWLVMAVADERSALHSSVTIARAAAEQWDAIESGRPGGINEENSRCRRQKVAAAVAALEAFDKGAGTILFNAQ
jgi:hypothetical protein